MMEQQAGWALIVHGGAKDMEPGEEEANRNGCLEAVEAGRRVLEAGGAAMDAVEASIRVLESLPVFNAGVGSVLNARGEVEMCSGLMDGRDLSVGAVGAIKGVRHPVSVAKALLAEKEVLLVGEGAILFAREKQAELCAPEDLIVEEQRQMLQEAHDTVGAVALDLGGNLAAGTSTGGLTGAPVGRVGDSPLPGCGYYADNHIGAVAMSGDGEGIARLAVAARVVEWMPEQGPETALEKALSPLPNVGGDGGGIAIDKKGQIGWWHNSPAFAVAHVSSGDPAPKVYLKKDEE
jgi:beta-aspartyl-peptidase (threonine type)